MKSAAPVATGIKPPWPPGAASAALSLSCPPHSRTEPSPRRREVASGGMAG